MRPRIRSVKPEMWEDEKIVALPRDARLLLIGLITMADDEGRFRARRSTILGHVFPGDDDAARRIDTWIMLIREQGLILFYVVEGTPYGAFRHWKRHQKINKPTPSLLPPPPDPGVVSDNYVPPTGGRREEDGSSHSPTRDHARGGPIRSFPTELQPHLEVVETVLRGLGERHGSKAIELLSLQNTITARPRKPLIKAAYDCAAYWDGQQRRLRDVVAAYRNWLDRCDDLASVEPLPGEARSAVVVQMQRPKSVQKMDRWQAGYDADGNSGDDESDRYGPVPADFQGDM